MSDNEIEVTEETLSNIEVSEVVGDPTTEELVGMPDGAININPVTGDQETIVYEYDDNNNFIGWHKEVV